jgi:phage-related protein
MEYRIGYYNSTVAAGIEKWPAGVYASFVRITEMMKSAGPNLGMPYTRPLGGGLFEIRARGREGIGRAFFCSVINREGIILHEIIKKTQKTPQKDILLARKRQKEIK